MPIRRLAILVFLALPVLGAIALAVYTLPSKSDVPRGGQGAGPAGCDSCTARHQGLSKDEASRERERALLRELYETSKGSN